MCRCMSRCTCTGGGPTVTAFYRPLTTACCPLDYGLLPAGPPTAPRLPRKSPDTRPPAPVHARPPRHPYGFARVESLCTRNRRTASLSSFNVRLQRPVFNLRPVTRPAAGAAVRRPRPLPRVPVRTHQRPPPPLQSHGRPRRRGAPRRRGGTSAAGRRSRGRGGPTPSPYALSPRSSASGRGGAGPRVRTRGARAGSPGRNRDHAGATSRPRATGPVEPAGALGAVAGAADLPDGPGGNGPDRTGPLRTSVRSPHDSPEAFTHAPGSLLRSFRRPQRHHHPWGLQ